MHIEYMHFKGRFSFSFEITEITIVEDSIWIMDRFHVLFEVPFDFSTVGALGTAEDGRPTGATLHDDRLAIV